MQHIRQAITKESLFLELQRWCREGAGRKTDKLQIISAFASGAAVEALEPFFDVFLADGNSIHIIIGIDRNGTDRYAIARLFELQDAYSIQFSCHVFHAPSYSGIFHPKLYLRRSGSKLSAIAGSANLTLGGLGNNFESLFLYEGTSNHSTEAKQLISTWDAFARPKAPLDKRFLRKLTRVYARTLCKSLPRTSPIERAPVRGAVKEMWTSVSKINLPRSHKRVQKQVKASQVPVKGFLLVDVLTETRSTQMQLPLAIVEKFFGLKKNEAGSIQLSHIRGGQITQPIQRQIVISGGADKGRLMRRIEMPQVAGKERPLAAIFFRLAAGRFSVALIPRTTPGYRIVDRVLSLHGQQPEYAKRRYYIGTRLDSVLRILRPVLQAIDRSPVL